MHGTYTAWNEKPGKWENFSSQGILNRLENSGNFTQNTGKGATF